MTIRALLTAAALATLSFSARPAAAQADFSSYVSVGDSLAAGVESASLVETHQRVSVPALIAGQAGVTSFELPLVSEPGLPPELQLVSLIPGPIILPKPGVPGAPLNLGLPRPYNNLAVPGMTSLGALSDTGAGGGSAQLVLRGLGTQIQQAQALRPTFITLWIGNNDVLGAAVSGRAIEGVTLTPKAAFRQAYATIVASLRATNALIVAANLPDVTTIPFVTTIAPVVVNPSTLQPVLIGGQTIPLLGPNGPLAPGTFVTLGASSLLAQGIGVPRAVGGTGTPLPDEVILDAGEIAIIGDFVAANNQAIADIAGAAGIPVVDIHGLLHEFATTGRDIGGVNFNAAFLTGGVISYDGVHPTDMGYAIVANEFIHAINSIGGNLPEVDLRPFTGLGTSTSQSSDRAARAVAFSQEAYEQLLAIFPAVN